MTTTLKNQRLCMTGLAAVLALTTFASVGGVQAATPVGVATTAEKISQAAEARFQSQVKQGYLDIANFAAARSGRMEVAEYFRTKAEAAQNQGFINPENPEYLVTLNGVNVGEARNKLVSYLTAEQIEKNPEAAAAALINFDCFVSEIDLKDETCLQNFAISLASLTTANKSMGTLELDPTEPSMPSNPEIPDRVVTNPPTSTPSMPPAPSQPPKNPPNHHPDPEYPNPHDPYPGHPHPGHPHPGHPHPGHPPTAPYGTGDATNGNDRPWQNAGISGHGEGSGGYDGSGRDSGPSASDKGGSPDSKDKGDDTGNNNDGVNQND